MRKLWEFVGGVLLIAGASGLIREWVDWFGLFGFMEHLNPFEGREIFWNLTLAVAGVAVLAASGSIKARGR